MAGNAQTTQVLLSTATMMVGPMADLLTLNPAEHSLGLVKNVTISTDPEFRDLTQGLLNDIVMSVKVGDGSRISMEVYEYTLRNFAYAAGLDGSNVSYDPITQTYPTTVAPTGTTVTLAAAPVPALVSGDYIYIQAGDTDQVHVAKVDSVAAGVITLATGWAIPAGMTFPAASRVGKVRAIDIGAQTPTVNLSAKITGFIDPTKNTPVTIMLPKIRITRGFNLAFTTDNYGNMPFEIQPYAQIPTDPMFAEFGTTKMKLLTS